MRLKGYSCYDQWALLPSAFLFTYAWGWSIQFVFLKWGIDLSYDYAKTPQNRGGNGT